MIVQNAQMSLDRRGSQLKKKQTSQIMAVKKLLKSSSKLTRTSVKWLITTPNLQFSGLQMNANLKFINVSFLWQLFQQLFSAYCDHKAGLLLPSRIKRTCPHAKRQVAQAPAVSTRNPDARIRICYFLIVHGRSLRQIKRLVKNIYHADHVLYFHVDSRSHWLHSELKKLTLEYPNIFLADWRETPIWGGTSLLTTIFRGLTDMVEKQYKWDFFINLSFADFPVKSNDDLVQFLFKYRDKNFMKSHGREPEKFITKHGLDRVFFECDNHMYRISERKTPIGIEIDGGSDWIALNREFSEWLVFSKDENLEQLKVWFNYTLLPAESFFHTAVQNTHWCESFVDNNIRVTNWNRARWVYFARI